MGQIAERTGKDRRRDKLKKEGKQKVNALK